MVLAGYRYSPPRYPPSQHPTPGTPPHPGYTSHHARYRYSRVPHRRRQTNSAVGLKSVAQLTWRPLIAGSRVMTEVYNLVEIDEDL